MQRALDFAAAQGNQISIVGFADTELPPKGSTVLDHPGLLAYFAQNPRSEFCRHKKLSAWPLGPSAAFYWQLVLSRAPVPRQPLIDWFAVGQRQFGAHPRSFEAMLAQNHWSFQSFLDGFTHRQPAPLAQRSRLLLMHNSTLWGRGCLIAPLVANGFDLAPPMQPHDFVASLMDSLWYFSPRGNGAHEHKFWEAALAGTIILTDYNPSQLGLLTGIPSVMVHRDAFDALTPARLRLLQDRVTANEPHGYDAMRAYHPQWLHRLQTGRVEASHTYDGRRRLSAPLVVGREELMHMDVA